MMFLDDQILFDDAGAIVFDCEGDCCGGIPPGEPCSLCNEGTTPLYMDVTFANFGCCYGGGMNATFKLTQVDPCNWELVTTVGGATITLHITRDLVGNYLYWDDGTDFYAWVEYTDPIVDCSSMTWAAQAQPPSFGPCAACKDAITASGVAGAAP